MHNQMNGFSFRSVAECMGICDAIETSFEAIAPGLFEKYFADRLHGRSHAWSVLCWCMRVSHVIVASTDVAPEAVDYANLVAAALLHDTAGLDLRDAGRAEHHIRAAEYIQPIVQRAKESTPRPLDAERVCRIARVHRLRADTPPETVSEEIIALADGLDESMARLYRGNRGKRPFYDETLSMDYRLKVVRRRNLAQEGIDREDARNDTLMFMLDSLVRNSVDYNPWRLVLSAAEQQSLRISDRSWQVISRDYFRLNYRGLIRYIQQERADHLIGFVDAFLDELSRNRGFEFLPRLREDSVR